MPILYKRALFVLMATTVILGIQSTPARAGATLASPYLWISAPEAFQCTVLNVGTSGAEVTVEALDGFGGVYTPVVSTCPTPPAVLQPGFTCEIQLSPGGDAACRVTGKGKLRAAVRIFNSTNQAVGAVVPLTAK